MEADIGELILTPDERELILLVRRAQSKRDAMPTGDMERACASCSHLRSDHEDGRGECSVPVDNSFCGCARYAEPTS